VKNHWYPGRKCKVGIDGNGNLLKKGDTTYTWDARDRLVSTGGGGSYGYDTSNLRTKMGEQKVLLDGIEEAREYGASEVRYDHDPSRVDGLLAQKAGGVKGYFVTDALGSVYAVVDTSGAVVSKYGYDVYGARTATTEGMATGWGFTGRRHDGAGEMYYRAREYYPLTNMFLSEDAANPREVTNHASSTAGLVPTRFAQDASWAASRYQYVGGNPTGLTDPLGLFAFPDSVRAYCFSLLVARNYRELIEFSRLMGFTIQQTGLAVQDLIQRAAGSGGAVIARGSAIGAGYRVADILKNAESLLMEIKFVNPETFRVSQQIKDMAAWASTQGFRFIIAVRDADRLCPNVRDKLRDLGAEVVEISSAVTANFWALPIHGGLP
jgi:RHS repeat-associated protein